MSASYNRIILVGNLTRDPEIRYVGSGAAVTKFTLAVNRRSKEKEDTDYIDCVAWEKLAETCNTYLKKGMSTLVEGRLSIRSYDDKEGNKRKATEVVVNIMQMLDRAGSSNGSTGRARPDENDQYGGRSSNRRDDAGAFDDASLEDDLPF